MKMTELERHKLLTAADLAAMLAVTPRTLARYRQSVPDFPQPIRITGGRGLRWKVADVIAFIEQR